MSFWQPIAFKIKALSELGLNQVGLYSLYRLGISSGYYRRMMKGGGGEVGKPASLPQLVSALELPDRIELAETLGEGGQKHLLEEADEIVGGQVRLFAGEPVLLRLDLDVPLSHWTAYESGRGIPGAQDIKYIWEPARFAWAYILGRAFYLTGLERYAQSFWQYTETFLRANPPNIGPNWASAQEVAIRLMALVFASSVFESSKQTTTDRRLLLAEAIAAHARRIPPTLIYARAQNNNHLLTEAVGLYTAGVVMPNHPQSGHWVKLGWRWLNHALQTQIDADGTYVQQSTNYHRLMLQAALWVAMISKSVGHQLPAASQQGLSAATHWLFSMTDQVSGCTPNLGPNDGAYIMPLAGTSFQDFRPVLQAAALAFTGGRLFPEGPWDEMAVWYGLETSESKSQHIPSARTADRPLVLHSTDRRSWAYLRAAKFNSRPGHADQLHLDLWWRGLNLAVDAGTYLYNGPPPWDNSLAGSAVHNTITVNGFDQMTRASRFLWLNWAQGEILSLDRERGVLVAQHNGYRRLNVIHRRVVKVDQNSLWNIEDHLLPLKYGTRSKPELYGQLNKKNMRVFDLRSHWLLPDGEWEMDVDDTSVTLKLKTHFGWITLRVQEKVEHRLDDAEAPRVQLVRAGESLVGDGPVRPEWGWFSPTYGSKLPALSLSFFVRRPVPHLLLCEWRFPQGER